MADEQHAEDVMPESPHAEILESGSPADSDKLEGENRTDATNAGEPLILKEQTPDEQMALYEKELKENDWGHQPC
jgi:hypothetical protein